MQPITTLKFNDASVCIVKNGRKHFAKVYELNKRPYKNSTGYLYQLEISGLAYHYNSVESCIDKINEFIGYNNEFDNIILSAIKN